MRHASVLALALCTFGSTALAQTAPVTPPSAATAEGPTARILSVRGSVQVLTPRAHDAVAGEILQRGMRIRTSAGSSADVALENGTVLELAERTQLMMFLSPVVVPGAPPTMNTTLLRGTIRTRVNTTNPRPDYVPIATASATVFVGRANALMSADSSGAVTRLAMYRGRARVRVADREYLIGGGNRVIERLGSPTPSIVLPLLHAPSWTTPPPERTLSVGDPVDVSGTWEAAHEPPIPGYIGVPPTAVQFRVQFARDDHFRDMISDTRLPATSTRWTARALEPGVYFVRVAAIDGERFESSFSPAVRFRVSAPRIVAGVEPAAGRPGQISRVEIPEGFYCNLDGGLFSGSTETLRLEPGRPHRMRCVNGSNTSEQRERVIPAQQAGPLHWDVRLNTTTADGTPRAGLGELVVRLRNAEGHPVSWISFHVTATEGVTIEPLRDDDERGSYIATVHWPDSARSTRIHITANEGLHYDLDAVLR